MSDPASAYNHFGTGNETTLSDPKIRDALLDFYHKHYSSNLMCLCVLNNSPIDDLETQVRELFSQIENKEVELPDISIVPPFNDNNTHKMVELESIEDKDIITLIWEVKYSEKEIFT